MKADVAHRHCSLEEMVKLVNSPKFAEELSFATVAICLCITNAFQHHLLRVSVRLDVSSVPSAGTLNPCGSKGWVNVARGGIQRLLGNRSRGVARRGNTRRFPAVWLSIFKIAPGLILALALNLATVILALVDSDGALEVWLWSFGYWDFGSS